MGVPTQKGCYNNIRGEKGKVVGGIRKLKYETGTKKTTLLKKGKKRESRIRGG